MFVYLYFLVLIRSKRSDAETTKQRKRKIKSISRRCTFILIRKYSIKEKIFFKYILFNFQIEKKINEFEQDETKTKLEFLPNDRIFRTIM